MRITNDSMDWRQPIPDPSLAAALFCSCFNNPDFCGPAENFHCPQCDLLSLYCSNVFLHQDLYSPNPPHPNLSPTAPTQPSSSSDASIKSGDATTPGGASSSEYTPLEQPHIDLDEPDFLKDASIKPGDATTPDGASSSEYSPLDQPLKNNNYKYLMEFLKLSKITRILAIFHDIANPVLLSKFIHPTHVKIYLLINGSQDIHIVKHLLQQTNAHQASLLDLSLKMLNSGPLLWSLYLKQRIKYLKNNKNSQTFSPPLKNPKFFRLFENTSPSSKYFKPQVSNNIIIASLRYDDKTAQEMLGTRFLPLLSSKDVPLVKLLSNQAHILQAGPFDLHLNRGGTLARMKTGKYAVIVPHARKIISPHLKKCVKCSKNDKKLQPSLTETYCCNMF